MVYVGIDPSFRCTGVSILDVEKKIFYINAVVADKVEVKSFSNIAQEAIVHSHRIVDCIQSVKSSSVSVITETPPPVGIFSAGLFSLDTALLCQLIRIDCIKRIFTLPCTYLRSVHGFKYKKSDSTDLATRILENFKASGYKWIARSKSGKEKEFGRINNDMAESFLFMCRLLVRDGCVPLLLNSARFVQKESVFLKE